jgi:hypothetical protein
MCELGVALPQVNGHRNDYTKQNCGKDGVAANLERLDHREHDYDHDRECRHFVDQAELS